MRRETTTHRMLEVLRTIDLNTAKQRGPNRGQTVRRIDARTFLDGRTVGALERRGWIDFRFETTIGTGHGVTAEGRKVLEANQ